MEKRCFLTQFSIGGKLHVFKNDEVRDMLDFVVKRFGPLTDDSKKIARQLIESPIEAFGGQKNMDASSAPATTLYALKGRDYYTRIIVATTGAEE